MARYGGRVGGLVEVEVLLRRGVGLGGRLGVVLGHFLGWGGGALWRAVVRTWEALSSGLFWVWGKWLNFVQGEEGVYGLRG